MLKLSPFFQPVFQSGKMETDMGKYMTYSMTNIVIKLKNFAQFPKKEHRDSRKHRTSNDSFKIYAVGRALFLSIANFRLNGLILFCFQVSFAEQTIERVCDRNRK